MQIKVAGVDTHNEGHGGAQHISQRQRAQGNVGALPVQREDHLKHRGVRSSERVGGGWGSWGAGGSLAFGWCLLKLLKVGSEGEPLMGAEYPCRLCQRRRLRKPPPQGRVRGGGSLTETRASQTLVSRSGRSEWTSSLCSVSTASSNVMASSGPRFCSSCRKLAPLWVTPTWGASHQETLETLS